MRSSRKDAIAGKPVHELAEARRRARPAAGASADEITLFKSVGTGIQDIALAAVIYRARRRSAASARRLPEFPYLKKS